MSKMTIKRNLVYNALVEANLVDGEDGLQVLPDYRPKFSGDETCFGIVFNATGDGYHFVVQLAYQLQAADSERGEFTAANLASEAQQDGPVLYFPGWTLEG